jgi:hypothetical protein
MAARRHDRAWGCWAYRCPDPCHQPAQEGSNPASPREKDAAPDHRPYAQVARHSNKAGRFVGMSRRPLAGMLIGKPCHIIVIAGDPGRARTYDLPLRRRLLYPAELRSRDQAAPEATGSSKGQAHGAKSVAASRIGLRMSCGHVPAAPRDPPGRGPGLRDATDPVRPERGSCRGTVPLSGDRA